MHLGEIIKEYRITHKMSQAEFAKISGISKGYVCMLENNRNPDSGRPLAPSYIIFDKVAKVLGCTTDQLMRMMDEGQMISLSPKRQAALELIEKLSDDQIEAILKLIGENK